MVIFKKPNEIMLTAFFLFLMNVGLFSQDLPLPYKFGIVDEDELKMTHYVEDTASAAVFLMNFGAMEVFSGYKPRYEVKYYFRIKILDKKAYHLADVTLNFLGIDDYEKIEDLKVQITHPDGKIIKLKKKQFIKEKLDENWEAIKFSFPKVMVGAVLEYEYKLVSKDLFEPRDWYFQYDYPSNWSEFRINLPLEVDYACIPQGVSSVKNLSQITPDGTIIYRLQKVQALKKEPFVTNLMDHYSKLKFQLHRIGFQEFVSSWKKLAKELVTYEGFGAQYRDSTNYINALNSIMPIVAAETSTKDTIKALYAHLSQELIWNKEYGRGIEQTVNQIYEEKSGTSGALNLSTVALLRGLGFEAYPILTSTRSNGEMNAQYPILDQFNHILSYVKIENETIILDLTDAYHPINYPKLDALNYRGWLVRDSMPEWLNIDFPNTTDVLKLDLTLDGSGQISGNLQCFSNGYSAINDRQLLEEEPEGDFWKERIQSSISDFQIDSILIKNQKDINKTLVTRAKVSSANMAIINEDYIYFSPILFNDFNENPFKSGKRQYNVDFPFPFKDQYTLNLIIPTGYEIEELPGSVNIFLRDKGATFKYIATQKDNKIEIASRINIKQAQYTPDDYFALKDFFDQIASKFNEQIVLRKK